VAEVADEVLVMYAGRVAETGSADDLFHQPGHPYAWGLLGSMPRLDVARIERLRPIPGTPPSLINVPAGCPFHPRCTYPPQATGGSCDSDIPALREISPGHRVACHLSTSKMHEIWQRLSDPAQALEPIDLAAPGAPVTDADPYGPADPNGSTEQTEEADTILSADPNYPSFAIDPTTPTDPSEREA
jgi:oligopeptide/dipeptide ABC transporter ATP-binding protein